MAPKYIQFGALVISYPPFDFRQEYEGTICSRFFFYIAQCQLLSV